VEVISYVVSDIENGTTSLWLCDQDRWLGRVFERDTGWCVELSDLSLLRDPTILDAILDGKEGGVPLNVELRLGEAAG